MASRGESSRAAEGQSGPSRSAAESSAGSSAPVPQEPSGPSHSTPEEAGPSVSATAGPSSPFHFVAESSAGPSISAPEGSSGPSLSAKAKGKQPVEQSVPANYRVYCISRSLFLSDSLQVQRFIFPAEMPSRFFELERHNEADMPDEAAREECRVFREDNHQLAERLVATHATGIFATRGWHCLVCGGAAVKLLHGIIPHFEVREMRREGTVEGVGEGVEEGEQEEVPYGASLVVPLTEAKTYKVKGSENESHMEKSRRYVNRLATKPIGGEEGIPRERLRPCVVDVAVPVCLVREECAEIGFEFGRELAYVVLRGGIKADPEEMLWGEPDENTISASESKEVERKFVQCANCGKLEGGVEKCAGCKIVGYCSRECQKWHWQRHKHECVGLKDQEHAAILLDLSRAGNESTRGQSLGSTAGLRGLEPTAEHPSDLPDYSEFEGDKVPSEPERGRSRKKGKGKAKETREHVVAGPSGDAGSVEVEPEEAVERIATKVEQSVVQVLEETDVATEVLGAEAAEGATATVRVEVTVKEVEGSSSDSEPQGTHTHEVTEVVGGASEVISDGNVVDTAATQGVELSTAGDQDLPQSTEQQETQQTGSEADRGSSESKKDKGKDKAEGEEVAGGEVIKDAATTEGIEPGTAGEENLPQDIQQQDTQKGNTEAAGGPSTPAKKSKQTRRDKKKRKSVGQDVKGKKAEEEGVGDEGKDGAAVTEQGEVSAKEGEQSVPQDTETQESMEAEGGGPSTPTKKNKGKKENVGEDEKGKAVEKEDAGDESVKDTGTAESVGPDPKKEDRSLPQDTETQDTQREGTEGVGGPSKSKKKREKRKRAKQRQSVGEEVKEEEVEEEKTKKEDVEKKDVEKEVEGQTEIAERVTEVGEGDGDSDGDADVDNGAVEVSKETETTEQPEAGEASGSKKKQRKRSNKKKKGGK